MTATLPLRICNDQPFVLDLDLAVALGMRRPIDIRTGPLKLYVTGPMEYGPLRQQVDGSSSMFVDPSTAYLLTEEQALFVCHFSTSRKADAATCMVISAFAQHKSLTVLLREALARTGGGGTTGREVVLIDALKARLRQVVRARGYTTRRQRLPHTHRTAGMYSQKLIFNLSPSVSPFIGLPCFPVSNTGKSEDRAEGHTRLIKGAGDYPSLTAK